MVAEDQPVMPGVQAVLSFGWYAHPLWRILLTSLKYQSAWCLTSAFEDLLKRVRRERYAPWPWAGERALIIVPIPPDSKRVRRRGCDHTMILAQCVKRVLLPWADVRPSLKKVGHTISNARLPTDVTRKVNVWGSFICEDAIDHSILLIDDVMTTGATLAEGVRALQQAGSSKIFILTFAHADALIPSSS